MLRLNLSKDPVWLDLGFGVRVQVLPASSSLASSVRLDPRLEGIDAAQEPERFALEFAKAMAVASIVAWEGVGDEDDNPAPVEAAYVEALLEVPVMYVAWQTLYMLPATTTIEVLDQEKNGSALSPSGISAGA